MDIPSYIFPVHRLEGSLPAKRALYISGMSDFQMFNPFATNNVAISVSYISLVD